MTSVGWATLAAVVALVAIAAAVLDAPYWWAWLIVAASAFVALMLLAARTDPD